jgi:2-aminoethylphosphonate transport system substrate-binding protein
MKYSNNDVKINRRDFLATGLATAAGLATSGLPRIAHSASDVVTLYSADGLRNGPNSFFDIMLKKFTEQTGIKVQYVEAGSAVIVGRVLRERANPQADVLGTLPPFVQKAAEMGLYTPYVPKAADFIPDQSKDKKNLWYTMYNNYASFIYNTQYLDEPPTFADLLNPKFKNKIQYSTPGEAGDGTTLLLNIFHAFGSKKAGLDYLKKLQKNNLGPSASTGKLTPLVNKGEIWVANGDLHMNLSQSQKNPNIGIFWPANASGVKSTLRQSYALGLTQGSPHPENGKKLIEFLLSKEAQMQISPIAYGVSPRTDIHQNGKNYKKIKKLLKDVEIWDPNWHDVAANLQSYISQYHNAIG